MNQARTMLMVSERATSRQGISTREAVGACLFGGLCVCMCWLVDRFLGG